jgi:hypothetical protein
MDDNSKIIHPGIKDSRVLTYLNLINAPLYRNTEEEDALLQLWRTKFNIAKSEYEKSRANATMVKIWRNAYEGDFNKLNDDGTVSSTKLKAIRKLAYELVEGEVNSNIPAPKMSPRYHADLVPVNRTEDLLKHEMDKMVSEEVNDKAEHHVLIDGFTWFKVGWNPFDNTHERSGNPIVTCCPIDTVYPQPGVENYKDLEYIFELTTMSVAKIADLYNRNIKSPTENDIVPLINCYFLNEDRYVGKFTWCDETGQVVCNDLEWGIRKERKCTKCKQPSTFGSKCSVCGNTEFKYYPVKEQTLSEPLVFVTNPYRTGNSPDINDDKMQEDPGESLPANTIIPHYLIRQLPFVPYRRISAPCSIYGISQVELVMEDQDLINKFLNKAERKSGKSRTYVTKLKDTNITTKDDEIAFVEVESPQEGQSIQVKQVQSDISEEITQSQMLYEIAKSTTGVTDTDQGKNDPSARSGKAKQIQMQASAQRRVSPTTLRNAAFAGVYELIFKNLLAYCDEERSYVSLLPDGTKTEEVWSKYMFLSRDDNGELYYRDDFAWSVDTATEITQDRASMWQLITNDFINGTLGTQVDPNRALLMYWHLMEQQNYPLAKFALTFLESSMHKLPSQVEKALVENPEAVNVALSYLQDMQAAAGLGGKGTMGGQRGGARPGAGREGNGATHSANVEKTNNKNRAESGSSATSTLASAGGGMQGGTNEPKTETKEA